MHEVYLEDVSFPIVLSKLVFENEDGTTGEFYLARINKNITYEQMTEFYKGQWEIEKFHKSLKHNISLAKSQTLVERAQRKHIFACLYVFIKLELHKMKTHFNYFTIKASIYTKAVKMAFQKLHTISGLLFHWHVNLYCGIS